MSSFSAPRLTFVLLLSLAIVPSHCQPVRVVTGVWTLVPINGTKWPISGSVSFSQDSGSEDVSVSVALTGLPPGSTHGLHVHAYGDLSNNCVNAGPHFNPYSRAHGARTNPEATRHIGDLGNVTADSSGSVTATFTDNLISLAAGSAADTLVRSIIGRTLVIHSGADDGGTGPNPPLGTSNSTGNAGARAACALLAFALTSPDTSGGALSPGSIAAIVIVVLGAAAAAGVAAWLFRDRLLGALCAKRLTAGGADVKFSPLRH